MARFVEDPSVAPDPGDDDAYLLAILGLKVGITSSRGASTPRLGPRREQAFFRSRRRLGTGGRGRIACCGGLARGGAKAPISRRLGTGGVALPPRPRDSAVSFAHSLLALGQKAEAISQAREAWRLLERWPGWLADETLALLRRLGVGQEVEGPKTLTSREREVAALLAEGLSNAEVADRLFISVRTAAVHVSHILTKLGMSSRAEVAAWAVRNGIAPTTDRAAG